MANIMTKRGSLDNIVTYEHYCDTKADLANIPENEITLGSTAIVLQDEDGSLGVYIATSDKEWIAMMTTGGSGGSGGESSSEDGLKDFLENSFSTFENSDVTKLRYYAFAMNGQLEEISLPNCSTINGGAFANCTALTSVDFPTLERIEGPEITQQESIVWDNSTSTSSIVMVESKGPGAFNYCSNLQTINIPMCSYIGELAFVGGTFSSIDLPNCTYIGSNAFATAQLESISIPKCSVIEDCAFSSCYKLSEITGDMVEEIGISAFANCYSYANNEGLHTANFPKCSSVKEVTMNVYGAYGAYRDQDILVGSTFTYCRNLATVSFPLLEKVVTEMFAYCSNLSQVYLPKCKTISPSAFYSCSTLTSIDLPELESFISSTVYVNGGVGPTQKTITEAFGGCTNLETVNLPKCKKVLTNTFTRCTNLKYIYLPVCEEIEHDAFWVGSSNNIESLYLLNNSQVSLGSQIFGLNVPLQSTLKIYVPNSLLAGYQSNYTSLASYFTAYIGE